MFNSEIGSLFQRKKRENRFSLAHYFAARAPFSLLARFLRSSTLTDSLAPAIRSDVSLTFEAIHLKQDTALLILIIVWSINITQPPFSIYSFNYFRLKTTTITYYRRSSILCMAPEGSFLNSIKCPCICAILFLWPRPITLSANSSARAKVWSG